MSLGQKAGLLFVVLATLLLAVTAQVVYQLRNVSLDARKFMEETREARIAHEMRSSLEQLELASQLDADQLAPGARRTLLERVRAQLSMLSSGRPEADPSRLEHEASEQQLYAQLRGIVDEMEAALGSGAEIPWERMMEMEEASAEMRGETAEEAAYATRDLERRVDGLVHVMAATALTATLTLVALFWLVRQRVVKPVVLLRQGTERFGEGELGHRIPVSTSDELGRLAEEFNRMADRVAGTHRDLEALVRERTKEFIRAARLADLGTFAAGVAHEVNTPLASIASSAEGLERRIKAGTASTEEQVEYLQTIAHEAYRARDITTRLLAFAREDPGTPVAVDVAQHVSHVARLMKHEMERRGLRLVVECDDGAPRVRASQSEIEQVLLNLVKNACDASPDGGVVTVRCLKGDGGLALEVEDEGPGVALTDRDRLFDPFFTTKRPGEGTGLGLSLVYRIVESRGGWVEVADGARGGALLRVRFPTGAAEGAA